MFNLKMINKKMFTKQKSLGEPHPIVGPPPDAPVLQLN
jgi:hypothetical protein